MAKREAVFRLRCLTPKAKPPVTNTKKDTKVGTHTPSGVKPDIFKLAARTYRFQAYSSLSCDVLKRGTGNGNVTFHRPSGVDAHCNNELFGLVVQRSIETSDVWHSNLSRKIHAKHDQKRKKMINKEWIT